MMPASNTGLGMSVGFPDVKLTPPLGVPVPYPNLALNAMSAEFSPNIFVGYMPQATMASIKPITLGNQGGVLHPLYMEMGGQTVGNARVLINCIPAETLCTPTFGNCFNNPIGLVAVPSVTTTMYSDVEAAPLAGQRAPLVATQIRALRDAVLGSSEAVSSELLERGIRLVSIRRMTTDLGSRVFNAMRSAERAILDLRGNPGGDLDATLDCLADFFDAGVPLLGLDRTGLKTTIESRGRAVHTMPIAVLVDRQTASAAEVLAASLQHHGRAAIVGERTHGKWTAQSATRNGDGSLSYCTVGSVSLPGGASFDGGVSPDRFATSTEALRVAIQELS